MKSLSLIILLTLGVSPISVVQAQVPSAETYQPGYWQPVARFDTKRIVEVNIINNTDIPIEYDLTDLEAMNPQKLEPQQTGNLKGFGSSANIVIYPLVNDTSEFNLRYTVAMDEDNNIVNVSVIKDKPSFLGHRSVNLQQTGAVYLY
ncbi:MULTISPECIES: hypothetical protein [Crocosphaera]|uniref:Uncharacterized protein n=5 Tax=Crocosphaera watsonii TaxID=263511 RepID=T2JXS0_CROWT|nr:MULTISPECIES: hypothetical protein [Crocosphaera]EHJ14800.1 hypothetical protein CWATWH0003_0539 [Crocosphaera watsonii WH 0003]MCH2246685.1 hypothetical protein [Crocosphaera sp.]NQZ65225.1 hypothetical protein [Crocosphaera sp.]CCQ48927.1 FIG00558098: hypothetical protein [Crocosphaera watsonii WH 8502]CCQ53902.1 hypothetical protein CWATWH0005_851 [Crocosphaera watsonii WH 0005]